MFGLGGCAFTYLCAPLLNNIYKKFKSDLKIFACIILVTLFTIDLVYSKYHPNTGEGISTPVAEIVLNESKNLKVNETFS